jgi:transposase, IS30 family
MKYQHFSIVEREKLQSGLWAKRSIRAIAKELGRSPSSVSREVRKNKSPLVERYTPRLAHQRALMHRSSRGRTDRLKNETIRSYVYHKLRAGFSPEQIAGRLRIDHPKEHISHEAIYQYIYAQVHRGGRGDMRPGAVDLRSYLKCRHKARAKHGFRKGARVLRPSGPSIDVRPAVVDRRTRLGDWESDTVESCLHRPGINTLVERKSGLLRITKLQSKDAHATRQAIALRLASLPAHLRRTVTFDNGPENQQWMEMEKSAGIRAYFAHPYHSWERGTNENTNGLIRWYFPKGTDFGTISDEALAWVEDVINTRPRKRLGWRTPLEVWSVALRS